MVNFNRHVLLTFICSLIFIVGVSAQTNLLPNGDLETMEPAFWNKLNDGLGGAVVSWASDEAAAGRWGINQPSLYSLKVEKSGSATDMVFSGRKSFGIIEIEDGMVKGEIINIED